MLQYDLIENPSYVVTSLHKLILKNITNGELDHIMRFTLTGLHQITSGRGKYACLYLCVCLNESNGEKLGESINNFKKIKKIVKKRCRINVNGFFIKSHNFILFFHHEKRQLSGKSTNDLLYKHAHKYTRAYLFLPFLISWNLVREKSVYNLVSMKRFSICHIL